MNILIKQIYAMTEIKNNRADIETYTELGFSDLVEYKQQEIERIKDLVNIVKETENHFIIDNSENGMIDIQSYFRYNGEWVPMINENGDYILDITNDINIILLAEQNDKLVGEYMEKQGLL